MYDNDEYGLQYKHFFIHLSILEGTPGLRLGTISSAEVRIYDFDDGDPHVSTIFNLQSGTSQEPRK